MVGYLPPERELCDTLAISRSTLRVVLRRLAEKGWIQIEHGRRTRISKKGDNLAPPFPPGSRNVLLISGFSPFSLDTNTFWLDELRRLFYLLGYTLVIEATHGNKRIDYWLPELKKKYDPALWILSTCPQKMSAWLAKAQYPTLISGLPHSRATNLPSICPDFHATCRHAAGQLIALGHRRIGLVVPHTLFPGDQQSVLGFQEGMDNHSEGHVEGIILPIQNNAASIFNTLKREFSRKRAATALIVCRPSAVIGVTSSLSSLNLRVPHDVSIICRDYNPSLLETIWPPLSHYYCDPTKIARKYISIFLKLRSGTPLQKLHSLILPEYRHGASVQPPSPSTYSPGHC